MKTLFTSWVLGGGCHSYMKHQVAHFDQHAHTHDTDEHQTMPPQTPMSCHHIPHSLHSSHIHFNHSTTLAPSLLTCNHKRNRLESGERWIDHGACTMNDPAHRAQPIRTPQARRCPNEVPVLNSFLGNYFKLQIYIYSSQN